ncbi:MAG TPA: hypothetical protein VK921_07960 [Anditalea sp.]|nr:hypothetical protein [Anditalea sp.]
MAKLNKEQIYEDMMVAVKSILDHNWKRAKPFAEKQIMLFTESLETIERLKDQEILSEEQAKIYIDIQKRSLRIALMTVDGLEALAVEKAINTALDLVKKTINTALGWKLIP